MDRDEVEQRLDEIKVALDRRVDAIGRRAIDEKQGFRRSVAEAPIKSCLAAFAAGAILATIAWWVTTT